MSSGGAQENVQEFKVRIPTRDPKKSFHIMKFNSSLRVDTTKWSQVRMVRENNRKASNNPEEEQPKFGAGSEYGREAREEARRRRYGYGARRYDPDAQPWLMRVGSKKEGRQYRGVREGGVAENSSYYVFTHAQDGSFEAHPIKEWYNFTPRVMYKTFNAEEAEERFAERGKILNHWAVMVNKKLRPGTEGEDGGEEEDGEGGGGKKGKKGGKGKDFKISDMDDWVDSGDELDSDDSDKDGSDDDDGGKKKGKKGKGSNKRSKDSKKKKKKKTEADSEGMEDSDDGDEEGREVDYMSDESSDSEEEMLEEARQKGVDQDEGLAKLLDSDSSEEENEDKDEDDEEEEDDDKPKKKKKKDGEASGDEDGEATPSKKKGKGSKNSSRATTPTPDGKDGGGGEGTDAGGDANREAAAAKAARAEKRKALVDNILDPNADGSSPAPKRSRMDGASMSSSGASGPSSSSSVSGVSSAEAAFEEEVRKYLSRKPMTTTEILKKVKSKKTGIDKDNLMQVLVRVLKRINPHRQKTKGTMYLSLKK